MCKVYGYARVSKPTQNIQRQIRNIVSLNSDAVIFQETYTGKVISRPEFEKLIKRVKPGDTIIFDSVSHNADDGFRLYQELYNNGVELTFLKEPHINTSTYRKTLQEKKFSLNFNFGGEATGALIKSIIDALNEYICDCTTINSEYAICHSK